MSSKRFYRYEELKAAARAARAKLFAEGKFRTSPRVRKKPRAPDDLQMLYAKALNTLRKYPPRFKGESLILPYFRDKALPNACERQISYSFSEINFQMA